MKKLALIGDCDVSMLKKATVFFTAHQDEKVTIFLSTYGGCTYSAFGIFDLMKAHRGELDVVCVGPVFSAGTIILMGGKRRLAFPLTTFLVHFGTEINDSLSEKKQSDRTFKIYKDILDKRTGVTRRVVGQWLNGETYMDARRAKMVGLIDDLIEVEDD